MMRKCVIGLTGGIASGKSSVVKVLEEHGVVSINADNIGHQVYLPNQPAYNKIVQVFGEDIVGQDGLINRKKLGGIVFSDKSEMKKLTDIVWPEIGLIVKKQVEEFRNSANTETQIMVVEAAVLVEAKWFDIPDVIWTLEIPEEIAVERIIERNNISREDAIARIRSQVSSEQRRTYARVEINTNRPKSETRQIILHHLDLLQHNLSISNQQEDE